MPVPNLRKTLDKYYLTVEPYVSAAALKEIKRDGEQFFASEDSRVAQDGLKSLALQKDNWLEDLWRENAYMLWRSPLMINSNVTGILFDKWRFTGSSQEFSAAAFTMGCLRYRELHEVGSIPYSQSRNGSPEDMDQYTRMFNLTRTPQYVDFSFRVFPCDSPVIDRLYFFINSQVFPTTCGYSTLAASATTLLSCVYLGPTRSMYVNL
jgi:carnitine O-acetyltransferase